AELPADAYAQHLGLAQRDKMKGIIAVVSETGAEPLVLRAQFLCVNDDNPVFLFLRGISDVPPVRAETDRWAENLVVNGAELILDDEGHRHWPGAPIHHVRPAGNHRELIGRPPDHAQVECLAVSKSELPAAAQVPEFATAVGFRRDRAAVIRALHAPEDTVKLVTVHGAELLTGERAISDFPTALAHKFVRIGMHIDPDDRANVGEIDGLAVENH